MNLPKKFPKRVRTTELVRAGLCPYRIALHSKHGIKTPANENMIIGSIVHRILSMVDFSKDWNSEPLEIPPRDMADNNEEVVFSFSAATKALKLARKYLVDRATGSKIMGRELAFEIEVPFVWHPPKSKGEPVSTTIILTGHIDRVDRLINGKVCVTDYKVGYSRADKAQLMIYLWALLQSELYANEKMNALDKDDDRKFVAGVDLDPEEVVAHIRFEYIQEKGCFPDERAIKAKDLVLIESYIKYLLDVYCTAVVYQDAAYSFGGCAWCPYSKQDSLFCEYYKDQVERILTDGKSIAEMSPAEKLHYFRIITLQKNDLETMRTKLSREIKKDLVDAYDNKIMADGLEAQLAFRNMTMIRQEANWLVPREVLVKVGKPHEKFATEENLQLLSDDALRQLLYLPLNELSKKFPEYLKELSEHIFGRTSVTLQVKPTKVSDGFEA